MGVVFSGLHPRSGRLVALKVLTDRGCLDPRYQRAFREEVRASAALDHPRVVSIYDVGRLSAPLRYSDPSYAAECPEGSPFLVMELVDGDPLGAWRGDLPWADLRHTALALLDALAHAHARGVIHRDLKPSNVLRLPRGEGFDLKLTDFGLAHPLDRDGRLSGALSRGGTPAYMAPEQIEGRWRDFGPWTDLYGLGCLIYAMAAGHSPFARRTARESQHAHLTLDAPPLVVEGAPPGFDVWVARLLEKHPARRFRCAADAAWALCALGGPRGPDIPWIPPRPPLGPAELMETRAAPGGAPSLSLAPSSSEAAPDRSQWFDAVSSVGAPPTSTEAPPIPEDWRAPGLEDGRWAPRPSGMGLGLFEQRATPLVGRDEVCDLLWSSLRLVDAFRGPRGLMLEGGSGVGKSTLARWLTLRAEALGAARALRASHSQSQGPFDGVAPMLARAHQCLGLSRPALVERLTERLPAWSLGGSPEALAGVMIGEAPGERGLSRQSRITDHLRRLAADRPLVIWLDDAQWGPEALALGLHLFDEAAKGRPIPALIIITVNTDRPPTGRAELLLRRWRGRPEVQRCGLAPLSEAMMGLLATEILGLEPRLAGELGARTRGNPLFAVQLVGDWVHRGLLESSDEGFKRAQDAPTELPDELHLLWMDRLRYALRVLPFDGWPVLERGATLGQIVDQGEWRRACAGARFGEEQFEILIGRLADEGLMAPADGQIGWRFIHPMLREALIRKAREEERLVAHHLACAQALAADRRPLTQGRRGTHLLAAGEAAQALRPLYSAALDRAIARDFDRAESFARLWRRAARQVRLRREDPRRGEGALLASRIARGRAQSQRSRWLVEATVEAARRHGWGEILARGLVERSWIVEREGRWPEAVIMLREAAQIASDLGLNGIQGAALRNQGAILMQRASGPEAAAALESALALYRGGRWPHGEALCHLELAQLHRLRGAVDEGARHRAAARARFETLKAHWGIAAVDVEAGQAHHMAGAIDEARRALAEAIERYQATQSEGQPVAELALAWLWVDAPRDPTEIEGARILFEQVEASFTASERQGRALSATLGRLAAGLGPEAGDRWDRLLRRALIALGDHHTLEIHHQLAMLRDRARAVGTPDQIEALDTLPDRWPPERDE